MLRPDIALLQTGVMQRPRLPKPPCSHLSPRARLSSAQAISPRPTSVLGPALPGYVRQDRSQMLRKPTKLLGVGFKGYHGTSIGDAKFHNLEREVELVRACQLVEVFVKQPSNDQGPPKYCVVPPEKAAAFERAAAVGAENRRLYSALLAEEFEFVDGATAAQQLVEAYDAHGRCAPAREASASPALKMSLTQDDHVRRLSRRDGRHPRLARQELGRAQPRGARLGLDRALRAVVPGAGKAQFEITHRPRVGAGAEHHGPHRLLRGDGQVHGARGLGEPTGAPRSPTTSNRARAASRRWPARYRAGVREGRRVPHRP